MATIATKTQVTLTLPAAEHIMKLGYWSEFRAMVEHTEETMPGLRSIHVTLDQMTGCDEMIVVLDIEVDDLRARMPGSHHTLGWDWDGWAVRTFSSDVLWNFTTSILQARDAGESHAG